MSEHQEVPAEFLADPGRYFLEYVPGQLSAHDGADRHFGKIAAVAQFHLTGADGGWWYFEMGDGRVQVRAGQHPKPSFTLTMEVEVWQQMHRGKLDSFKAWFRGDIKFTGSRFKFMRVAKLFS